MSLPEAALSTKNKFSFRNSVSGESHARARRKAVRLSPNQQEHRGQMLKRNLMAQDHLACHNYVHNSHPTLLSREDIMRLSSGRRALRLMPPNEAGAPSDFFEKVKSRRVCRSDQ
jgi:hypothetical protein